MSTAGGDLETAHQVMYIFCHMSTAGGDLETAHQVEYIFHALSVKYQRTLSHVYSKRGS